MGVSCVVALLLWGNKNPWLLVAAIASAGSVLANLFAGITYSLDPISGDFSGYILGGICETIMVVTLVIGAPLATIAIAIVAIGIYLVVKKPTRWWAIVGYVIVGAGLWLLSFLA